MTPPLTAYHITQTRHTSTSKHGIAQASARPQHVHQRVAIETWHARAGPRARARNDLHTHTGTTVESRRRQSRQSGFELNEATTRRPPRRTSIGAETRPKSDPSRTSRVYHGQRQGITPQVVPRPDAGVDAEREDRPAVALLLRRRARVVTISAVAAEVTEVAVARVVEDAGLWRADAREHRSASSGAAPPTARRPRSRCPGSGRCTT